MLWLSQNRPFKTSEGWRRPSSRAHLTAGAYFTPRTFWPSAKPTGFWPGVVLAGLAQDEAVNEPKRDFFGLLDSCGEGALAGHAEVELSSWVSACRASARALPTDIHSRHLPTPLSRLVLINGGSALRAVSTIITTRLWRLYG
jgi:hypothetical protein